MTPQDSMRMISKIEGKKGFIWADGEYMRGCGNVHHNQLAMAVDKENYDGGTVYPTMKRFRLVRVDNYDSRICFSMCYLPSAEQISTIRSIVIQSGLSNDDISVELNYHRNTRLKKQIL